MTDPLDLLLLFLAGVGGGIFSAIAGGASFVTFPALLHLGLAPFSANTTNAMALFPANLAALLAFRGELAAHWPRLLRPLLLAVLGGLAGAGLLMTTPSDVFKDLVPWLLLTATLAFAFGPRLRAFASRLGGRAPSLEAWWCQTLIILLAGYCAYFGAGVGMLYLALFIYVASDNIHVANTLKNIVISAASIVSVGIYAFSGTVVWSFALAMMAGATTGGFLGGRLSKVLPQWLVRLIVIGFGVFFTVVYFYRSYLSG